MSKAKKLMAQMYGIPYKGASSATLLLIKKWRERFNSWECFAIFQNSAQELKNFSRAFPS